MDQGLIKELLKIAEEGDMEERMAKAVWAAGMSSNDWLKDSDARMLSVYYNNVANDLRDLEIGGSVGRGSTVNIRDTLRRMARTPSAKSLIQNSKKH